MSRFGAIKSERARTSAPHEPTQTSAAAAPPTAGAAPATVGAAPAPAGRSPARIGKKAVGGYFSPQLSQALNILALEQDTTLQALLGEAIDDLMRKYAKHPFGER